jgi:hypothetical protein
LPGYREFRVSYCPNQAVDDLGRAGTGDEKLDFMPLADESKRLPVNG